MTGSATPGGKTVLSAGTVAVALALFVIACGSDGTSGLKIPDSPNPVVGELTGVVYGPACVVEPQSCPTSTAWPFQLNLISAAYANLYNEMPFGIGSGPGGAHIVLSSVTQQDAADGRINSYDPIVGPVPADADGRYRVISHFVETFEVCQSVNEDRFIGRLLVSVKPGDPNFDGLTRAFVTSTQTDVDASTEAVVRLVLKRIFEYDPPVQLCDFDIEGLADLVQAAQNAAFTAEGETVGEMNDDAYRLASENCKVLRALDNATGMPVNPPLPCVRG